MHYHFFVRMMQSLFNVNNVQRWRNWPQIVTSQQRWKTLRRAPLLLSAALLALFLAAGLFDIFTNSTQVRFGSTVRAAPLTQPTPPPLANVSAIATGSTHTCAVMSHGNVNCWGSNSSGQLGNDTADIQQTFPIHVSTLSGAVEAIATGAYHTCVVTDGGVQCWGRNIYGQLGDESNTRRDTPVNVVGLASGVGAVAAGFDHTCALTTIGGVNCWGRNHYGQLGNGTTVGSNVPVPVSGLTSGVIAIAAGGNHTCALMADGGVNCWGDGLHGQLGNGKTGPNADSATPAEVLTLSTASAIAAGEDHTCALLDNGGIKCWGRNSYGQLGNGDSFRRDKSTPVDVIGFTTGAVAVATGDRHTCAVKADGQLHCWGRNQTGQLGNGNTSNTDTPVNVATTNDFFTIATGTSYSCALMAGGSAQCWGNNADGQLGNGTQTSALTPVAVIDTRPIAIDDQGTTDEDMPIAIAVLTNDLAFSDSFDYSSLAVAEHPTHGIASVNSGTGEIIYNPALNYVGNDSFTYEVCYLNAGTLCAAATVQLTITAVNDAPIAETQSLTVVENTTATITLSGSDIETDPLTYQIVSQPEHGTLSGTPPLLTYTPRADYIGEDAFTFRVDDGTISSTPATITITVTDPQSAAEDQTGSIATRLTYATFDRTAIPPYATLGTYTLRYSFTNNSGVTLSHLFYRVVAANSIFLLNTDGGTPGGVGAEHTVANVLLPGGDGLFQNGETLTNQELLLGVVGKPANIRFAIYAVPQTARSSPQFIGYITVDSEQLSVSRTEIYLPMILR